MGLWDRIRHELIDIIEWLDDSRTTMVHRFERSGNEIKYGAKLVVREGQVAVFVNEGRIADVFQPGTVTLETKNLPILSTLMGWKYGFESPFKAEVYFVSTRRFSDLKWGTKNPIMLRDAEFGPIRLRAFGSYEVRVSDAAKFIREVVGTDGTTSTAEITDQLRNLILARFTDVLGESKIPALDLAANYDEIGGFVAGKMHDEFQEAYGLDVTKLVIENISVPPEVEAALDKRASMGVIGDVGKYTQFQAAQAMEAAAANPGGGAAEGMGLGMGFAMAHQMAGTMGKQQTSVPPPLPATDSWFAAVDGKQAGPFDVPSLGQLAQSGKVTRATLVWKQGMAGWVAAEQVAELASIFASVPPPLPQ